jgi:replication-associated recombination protein RarA
VLWRRLEIIATEDVGWVCRRRRRLSTRCICRRGAWLDPGDRWIYCAHAVRLLATAKKDNMSMELSGWTREVVERGERKVEVEDFMVDLHTRRGVEMGRTVAHWWNEGAKLENRMDGYDPKWGDYLRKLAGAKVEE